MNGDSLPKPATLQGQVEIEMRSGWATVQMNNYSWDEPREATFKSDVAILDFVLSRRAADLVGCYLETPRCEPRPIGEILLMPPEFTLHSRWESGARRSLCCALDFRAFGKTFDMNWGEPELMASLDVNNSSVRRTLLCLANEMMSPGFASDIMVESLCTSMMVELYRHFNGLPHDDVASGACLSAGQIRRIRERLEAESDEPASVAALAREQGMSVRHFSRLFRQTTGETVSDFAASIRIARAKSLLSARHSLIKQVAYACGFKSTSAFSSAFRRATGLTPQQFRETHMQLN